MTVYLSFGLISETGSICDIRPNVHEFGVPNKNLPNDKPTNNHQVVNYIMYTTKCTKLIDFENSQFRHQNKRNILF